MPSRQPNEGKQGRPVEEATFEQTVDYSYMSKRSDRRQLCKYEAMLWETRKR